MTKISNSVLAIAAFAFCLGAPLALSAKEFYVGEPIVKNNLQLVPHYLEGIEMDRMPKGMSMNPKAVHLEIDVHATKGETHGFHEDEWIPYLTIRYRLEKVGGKFKTAGKLFAMTAGDGPHYANNVMLAGEGDYHLTFTFDPPSKAGFIRHVDKDTGVPAWWEPFAADWTFHYPSKPSQN
ncbi:MAG: iron transporter [Pseudolabrys sp.]